MIHPPAYPLTRPTPIREGNTFSIIVIPDTQHLARLYHSHYETMADWIVSNAERINLQLVLHVGDLVHNGNEAEYTVAGEAMDKVYDLGIPVLATMGNHDYDGGSPGRSKTTLFNAHFGVGRYELLPWYGGVFEAGQAENIYLVPEFGGRKWLVMALEFGPREAVMDWCSGILDQYPDRQAIINTHTYMFMDGHRTKVGDSAHPASYGGIAQDALSGEEMWQGWLKAHPNLTAVFSGHHIYANVSHRIDVGDGGNLVFQAFQNWQQYPEGGQGRFRILTYNEQRNLVHVETLNPVTGNTESAAGYEVDYPAMSYIQSGRGSPFFNREWDGVSYPPT